MQVQVSNLTIDPPAAFDQCDRCGVRAIVKAAIAIPEGVLWFTFCGHHFDEQQKGAKPFHLFNDTRQP